MTIIEALSLTPIYRGFIVLIISGIIFPLSGVFIVRLNLIPLRFTLMHGSLLGGIIALGLGFNPLLSAIVINIFIILLINPVQRYSSLRISDVTSFLMVATIAISFALIYKFSIPAMDAFQFLWGNLYAVSKIELLIVSTFGLLLLIFIYSAFRKITAILFNKDIAYSSGVNVKKYSVFILIIAGITISLAMKITGTLLLDSLLILPALTASLIAVNTKQLFLFSSLSGFISSISGFIISIYADLPAGPSVALSSSLLFIIIIIFKKIIIYIRNIRKSL